MTDYSANNKKISNKISKKDDDVSIYTRFFIFNLITKLVLAIFYLIPLDGIHRGIKTLIQKTR